MPCALTLALLSAGNSIAARIAMIAMTTSNSIRVKPPRTFLPAIKRLGSGNKLSGRTDGIYVYGQRTELLGFKSGFILVCCDGIPSANWLTVVCLWNRATLARRGDFRKSDERMTQA